MRHPAFSDSFASACKRFRAAVAGAGGVLHSLPLTATGPDGAPLALDIAWFGARQPRRALLHLCGIHGVEGFAGSAVQLALLEQLPPLPADAALILVHVLNPYGMTWLRRTNGSNVDLNRNFFFEQGGWQGAPAGYAALDSFLNPARPPARVDGFHLRLLLAELSLGRGAIHQAVAGGQYHFPRGIFYGGDRLEEEGRLYTAWLGEHLHTAQELLVIDVHSGLGAYGQQTLFLRSAADAETLSHQLGRQIATGSRAAGIIGYEHEGGQGNIYRRVLPQARTICLTAEFGTYTGRRLLRALRAENQYHHYGSGRLDHWSKRKLQAMFSPDDPRWQDSVVRQGCDLVQQAARLLACGALAAG